ncbi:glycosyltransferase family 2 protein [Patescibacteria group bacterium]
MNSKDLSLVLATYNEETHLIDSIRRIIKALKRSGLTYELIFVDDKSLDGTVSILESFQKKHPQWTYIYHTSNQGRGKSVSDGIMKASGKVVGYIDVDLEVSPIYIPELANKILEGRADFVIGKRIYRTTLTSLVREVLSVGYQIISDWMIGTGRLDTESGYKFFDRKKILPVVKKTIHPHWFWDTEVTVLAMRKGLKVVEEPVLFLRRFDKESTVNIFQDTLDYLVSLWKFRNRLQKL